jgi:hypothetical protein
MLNGKLPSCIDIHLPAADVYSGERAILKWMSDNDT